MYILYNVFNQGVGRQQNEGIVAMTITFLELCTGYLKVNSRAFCWFSAGACISMQCPLHPWHLEGSAKGKTCLLF